MRRRHFRRLPRYRPYHGSLPSPFSVLRNKKKKKFSLSTLFSLLSANRRRAVARNPFCPKLFTSSTRSSLVPPFLREKHCESRWKDNIKHIQRKERCGREFTIFIMKENDFYLFIFFLKKDSPQFMNFPREFCRSKQESVTQEPSDETGGAVEK